MKDLAAKEAAIALLVFILVSILVFLVTLRQFDRHMFYNWCSRYRDHSGQEMRFDDAVFGYECYTLVNGSWVTANSQLESWDEE